MLTPLIAAVADHSARIAAIEHRLDGTPNPPPDPPPPPPPPPSGDVTYIGPGVVTFEEIHVHEGKTLVVRPNTELVRIDVPPANPGHADGGIVVHGTLIADATDGPIVIRSENPSGHRGHLMIHGDAQLTGVEIRDFGRTQLGRLSDENPIARYACHWHLAGDRPNSFIRNCRIFDTVPGYRYGIVIHGTNGVQVTGNHVHHKAGAGILLEDGTERGNLIENNLVEDIIGTQMPPNPEPDWPASREMLDGDWAFAGNGFALRSGGNIVRNNVVRRAPIGYLLWFQHQGPHTLARGEFDNNLAEDCLYDGLQPWRIGIDDNWTAPPIQSIISNFTARRCGRYGVYNYYVRNLLYDGLTVEHCRKRGYFGGDYHEGDLSFRNFTARNCGAGYMPSTVTEGVITMDGAVMEGNDWADVVFRSLYSSGGGASCQPREVRITNADLRSATKVAMYRDKIEGQNHILPDKLWVNGRRIYYREQAADAICPATGNGSIGCPEAGLTNRQAFDKYGVCVAGEIAPPEARDGKSEGIEGLIV